MTNICSTSSHANHATNHNQTQQHKKKEFTHHHLKGPRSVLLGALAVWSLWQSQPCQWNNDFRTIELNIQHHSTIFNHTERKKSLCSVSRTRLVYVLSFTPFNGKNLSQWPWHSKQPEWPQQAKNLQWSCSLLAWTASSSPNFTWIFTHHSHPLTLIQNTCTNLSLFHLHPAATSAQQLYFSAVPLMHLCHHRQSSTSLLLDAPFTVGQLRTPPTATW